MNRPWKSAERLEFEYRRQRTFGEMHVSETGGPARRLITGREPHSTGSMVCIKAGFRKITWESQDSEMPLIPLAEVVSPIRRLASQPHRLDMKVVSGPSAVLKFFPDFEFVADARFVKAVEAGEPFWEAALRWQPNGESFDWRTLIAETKRDDDPRARDPEYLNKLDQAREFYHRIGYGFADLRASKDLPRGEVAKGVNRVFSRAMTLVTTLDIARVSHVIERAGGSVAHEEASAAIASGGVGRSKLSALHVRRVVRIDLSKGLKPDSPVGLVGDGVTIL
ncbi:hypothetical protein ACVWWG_004646 [Bradyrhizobium sp. LB7.2]